MENSSRKTGRRRLRDAVVAIGVSGALVGGSAGFAAASQGALLAPGQKQTFRTWFFGRTEVCVQDVSPYAAGYTWWGTTTSGSGGLWPGQQQCFARSFVGIPMWVANGSAQASIQVTFPIGP